MSDLHRNAQVTANDRGPLVNVASWILMVTAILFTAFRLISNVVLRGRFGAHDWLVTIAALLGVCQSIASSIAVGNGLGKHQDTLSPSMIASYQKASLASVVLYVATLAANKLSLLAFLSEMVSNTQTWVPKALKGLGLLVGLYTIAAIIALSLACDLPASYNWLDGKCINLLAFWDFHAVFEIVSSLVVFVLPIAIVLPLQMKVDLKTQVVFPFALEIPLCAFAIVRLVYLHKALDAQDQTWQAVNWQVWTAISMFLGTVAANIPSLKIFLKGFESVLFRQDTARLQTELRSYNGKTEQRSAVRSAKGWKPGYTDTSEFRPNDGESSTAIMRSSAPEDPTLDNSDRSSIIQQDPRIYKTTEWTVLESGRNV